MERVPILPSIRERLPATAAILDGGGLTVHHAVERVVLSGSRGLRGRFRPDSDLDLSLLVDRLKLDPAQEEASALRSVLEATLGSWRGHVPLDLIAVFDERGCGLSCFDCETSAGRRCSERGIDRMGLFKVQKGFDGYVRGAAVDIERVYPIITVYERAR